MSINESESDDDDEELRLILRKLQRRYTELRSFSPILKENVELINPDRDVSESQISKTPEVLISPFGDLEKMDAFQKSSQTSAKEMVIVKSYQCQFEVKKDCLIRSSPFFEWLLVSKNLSPTMVKELDFTHLMIDPQIMRLIFYHINTGKGIDLNWIELLLIQKLFDTAITFELKTFLDPLKEHLNSDKFIKQLFSDFNKDILRKDYIYSIFLEYWRLATSYGFIKLQHSIKDILVRKLKSCVLRYPSVYVKLDYDLILALSCSDEIECLDERELYDILLFWCKMKPILRESRIICETNVSDNDLSNGFKELAANIRLLRFQQTDDLIYCSQESNQKYLPIPENMLLTANWILVSNLHKLNMSPKILKGMQQNHIRNPRKYLANKDSVRFQYDKLPMPIKSTKMLELESIDDLDQYLDSFMQESCNNNIMELVSPAVNIANIPVCVVLSGCKGRSNPSLLQILDLRNMKWSKIEAVPFSRSMHQIAFAGESLYVIGGFEYSEVKLKPGKYKPIPTSKIYKYTKDGRWIIGKDMPIACIYHSLAVSGSDIYIVGGQDADGNHLSTVTRLDTKIDAYSRMASLSSARLAATACLYNESIWVMGGFEHNSKYPIVDTVECFNVINNTNTSGWCKRKPLRFPRCHASSGVALGKLYICGGATLFTNKNSDGSAQNTYNITSMPAIDVYNEDTDTWSYVNSLKIPRHRFGMITYDSKIFVIGGVSSLSNLELKEIECLNIQTNQLVTIPGMLETSIAPSACYVPYHLFHK